MSLIVGNNLELKGSLKLGNKEYKISDIDGYIDFKELDIPNSFYGGNATAIAKTKTDGVYIVMHHAEPIDLLVKVEDKKEEKKTTSSTTKKTANKSNK